MKVYCPTCGSGTEYSLKKPKFCAGCGEAFSALNKAAAKRVFRTDPKNPVATIQEEVEEEEGKLMIRINEEHAEFDSLMGQLHPIVQKWESEQARDEEE